MSAHKVEIVKISNIRPHPNADKLELTNMWGWQCCVGKGQFKIGDKAVYIPPDYLVPLNRKEFAFLKNKDNEYEKRIKVKRLRGEISQGLIIPVPPELKDLPEGTNVIHQLNIRRYEPPIKCKSTRGMFIGSPAGLYCPRFDVENWRRYTDIIEDGEYVWISEKIHGANSRFTYAKDKNDQWQQFCGSRNNWMAQDEDNLWWQALKQNPSIKEWCRNNPEKILYGEVFGNIQDLKYGADKNQVFFAAFAILDKQTWLNFQDFKNSCKQHNVPIVPILYEGKFNKKLCCQLSSGNSCWPTAKHIREGIVITPTQERRNNKIGRVILKIINDDYLERD